MFKNLARFYYNKGLRLAREDQIKPAVNNLIKAISYSSDFIEAWNLAGLCYYRLGNYETAKYCWVQSVNKPWKENGASQYLADLRNDLEEADPYFSQVASLCRQEKYGEAAEVLDKEICSKFDLSTALLNLLGVLQVLDGKTYRAVKSWRTVLSFDKSNTDAPRYLADMEKSLSYKLFKWKERLFKRNDIKGI